MEAYVFLSCEPLLVWEIAEAAVKIEGVKMARAGTKDKIMKIKNWFRNIPNTEIVARG